jgi:ribonucleoside-triphosphate reductase
MYDLLPKVKTSKNTEETFDPKRIYESLKEETILTEDEANEVAIELARRVIAYKIPVLTSPEIREMVCSILLEKGYDKARFMYTRLGLPFYDFDELITSTSHASSSQEKPFGNVEELLDREIRKERVYRQMKFEYEEIKKIIGDLGK